jgi:hypothetical protein
VPRVEAKLRCSARVLAPHRVTVPAPSSSPAGPRSGKDGGPEATLTVRRAASRTTLTLSPASVKYEHETSVKITVAVAPQFSGTPAGNVIIRSGQATLCTARLASATHTCPFPSKRALSPGRHVLTASYQGSADFAPSSAVKTLTVTRP